MSTKNFDVDALGFSAEVLRPILFGKFDFEYWPMFLHTAVGVYRWGERDWIGLGNFVSVDPVEEHFELNPSRLRLGMMLTDPNMLAYVVQEATAGRLCELYAGAIDADGTLISTPNLVLSGVMGPASLSVGTDNVVSVEVTDVRGRFGLINGRRASLEDHQELVVGDLFFEWVPKMIDHTFVFNGRAGGGRGGNIGGSQGVQDVQNYPIPENYDFF